MYTSFYNLQKKPFQISSDPAFIWLGEKHKEALATLTYGVMDNKGFMLLTGDVGTGKTTLINTLIKGLSDDVLYASIPDPRLGLNDFLNYVASAFKIKRSFKSKGKFLIYFSEFLQSAHDSNKKVLLLIDESQLLTQNMLEEIRLLSNIQKDGDNLLNIFFVGQDEFNEILGRQENRAVAQRLTLNYHLAPLTEYETTQYIKHRLQVAGTSEQLFDDEAIQEIQAYSGGFPRRVNIICDHCLLTGFVKEQKMIDAEIVRICAHDLKIPQYTATSKAAGLRPIPPHPGPVPAPVAAPAITPLPDISLPTPVVAAPAPIRPLPQQRPGLLQRIFQALCLLVGCGFLLFVFDPTTFRLIYDEGREYVMSVQDKLNIPSFQRTNRADNMPDIQEKAPEPEEEVTAQSLPEKSRDAESIPEQQVSEAVAPVTQAVKAEKPLAEIPFPRETIIIRFDNDSSEFYFLDFEKVDELASAIKKHPDVVMVISGHTDSMGSEGYNYRLSLFRANMIKSFFLGKGIPSHQLKVRAFGSKIPLTENDTDEGRRMNRRVEVDIVQ